ncbi:hypothetical protein JTB14_023154 [Gonioctena quinquepunctata]|nr:hypothetical protein JTB14_023154 [Gonioctena quinquepunctata]
MLSSQRAVPVEDPPNRFVGGLESAYRRIISCDGCITIRNNKLFRVTFCDYFIYLCVFIQLNFSRLKMKLYVTTLLLCSFEIHSSTTKAITDEIIPSKNKEDYGLALEAIFSLGIRLQAILETSTSPNFVISPLSTTALVSELMMGADGVFQEQLYKLLSLPKTEHTYTVNEFSKEGNQTRALPYANFHFQLSCLIKALRTRKVGEQFDLNLDNALFYNQNIELRNDFKKNLYRFYNTEIKALDFQKDAKSTINSWASEHTNGLIKSVMSSAPSPSTASLFLNSIYFRADWETPFSDFLNTRNSFHISENTTVDTDYMMGLIPQIKYAATSEYRMICLPYKNNELGMYIFLPTNDNVNKYDIKTFTEKMNPKEVLATIEKAKIHDVVVRIPKLSLSNTWRILKPLQKYTEFKKVTIENRASSDNAIDELMDKVQHFKNFSAPVESDILLSGAAKGIDLRVSDIVQQMVFSLNEKGTEAAAVTLGITDYMGGAKTMLINRPFSFFIRHEETAAVIFWGTIGDPSKN